VLWDCGEGGGGRTRARCVGGTDLPQATRDKSRTGWWFVHLCLVVALIKKNDCKRYQDHVLLYSTSRTRTYSLPLFSSSSPIKRTSLIPSHTSRKLHLHLRARDNVKYQRNFYDFSINSNDLLRTRSRKKIKAPLQLRFLSLTVYSQCELYAPDFINIKRL
jgi:hypothetical protein